MVPIIPTLILVLMRMIRFLLRPIFALIHFRKPPGLPPIKNPILKLSATNLAKCIRNKELSSHTVVEAYIQRIKEVNPLLNAVVEDCFDAALQEAKQCDIKLENGEVTAATLETDKPLYGVPVTIKESCGLKGLSYTGGTISRKGVKAMEDGKAVELLKNAGAIPLLVSNTSEYCTAINSFNYLFGLTVNPYDRRKTVGGSSGGEASLIGAGASVLGLGSDLVGSVRLPALFTGIFGHKPSPGVVPLSGHLPLPDDPLFQTFLVLGPLARYAEDLHLAMKILASKCEKPLRLDDPVDLKNLKVYYLDNVDSFLGMRATTPEIKQAVHKVVHYLADQGAEVEELSQHWVHDFHYVLIGLLGELNLPCLFDLDHPENKRNAILEYLKSVVGLSQYTSTLAFVQTLVDTKGFLSSSKREYYKKRRLEIEQGISNKLKGNTILVSPTYRHGADVPQFMFFEPDAEVYCALANVFHLPATHIPTGLNKDGLPIGIQVSSATYQDHICLAVARELEKVFGGWIPPS